MQKITLTQEDYLRAIYLLSNGGKESVRIKDLVEEMNLAKSTITERLNSLEKNGWIKKEVYKPIELTKQGLVLASNLTYKHRLIELFLTTKLGMNDEEVHVEAHKLEHAFSDKVIVKLADFLDNPKRCPHGSPLPKFKFEDEKTI